MGVHADLHVHTTNSDGTLPLDALPETARAAGVAVVGVTDHDRLHPDLEGPVVEREGVTVVHGVELRVAAGEQRVDLLGYGVEPTGDLVAELDALQADRVERAARMVARVEAHLGIDLDVEAVPGVGRPHVARAVIAHPDTDYETAGAVFRDLIAEGRPCYVARDVPGFERGAALLRDACGLVALAHPFRYDDPAGALALTADLDAVERYYPYESEVDPAPVDAAIADHDLVPTGGSDAHGTELGLAGLDRAGYAAVRERLGDSPVPQG